MWERERRGATRGRETRLDSARRDAPPHRRRVSFLIPPYSGFQKVISRSDYLSIFNNGSDACDLSLIRRRARSKLALTSTHEHAESTSEHQTTDSSYFMFSTRLALVLTSKNVADSFESVCLGAVIALFIYFFYKNRSPLRRLQNRTHLHLRYRSNQYFLFVPRPFGEWTDVR